MVQVKQSVLCVFASPDNNFWTRSPFWPTELAKKRDHYVWLHIFAMPEQMCTVFGTLQCRFVLNTSVNSILIKFITKWHHLATKQQLQVRHIFKTTAPIFMVALWNRADHYIFMLWFVMAALWNRGAIIFLPCGYYLSFYLFFPRLISAAGDWMSTILPHMVWP